VDRARLVPALSKGAVRYDKELTCLVQVDLGNAEPMDAHAARGGARPDEVLPLADAIAAAPGLTLGGLMAVAPLGEDPAPAFARLHELALRLRSAHPSATMISAGMSGDLGEAVAAGATHVRIGSAIPGNVASIEHRIRRPHASHTHRPRTGNLRGTHYVDRCKTAVSGPVRRRTPWPA
jgi:uncharacterized pyridoxal phosphate-containing UPF0001 family protein